MERIQRAIGDIVVKAQLPFAAPDDTVSKAVELMCSRGTSCVLVMEVGQLRGIFTERDFLIRVAAAGRRPEETPVGKVMTQNPETLRLAHNAAYAINKMVIEGFRNVPIVNESGQPVAVLSVRDIIGQLVEIFGEANDANSDEPDSEWVDTGGG